jgi:hypothetical protein
MDISYSEAQARFKVDDHFKINNEIHKKSMFLPGDVVKLVSFYHFGDIDNWGINCEFVEKVPGPRLQGMVELGGPFAIHSMYIDPVGHSSSSVCKCNIFVGPCTCGAFEREKEVGHVAKPQSKHTYF